MRGLASGIAGTVAATSAAPSSRAAVAHALVSDQAAALATTGLPRLLDQHQRRTLASLADLLVPGAAAAGAVDMIDRVAAVDTLARQRLLLNAIGAFEHVARTAHGKRWVDLDEPARLDVLREVSAGQVGPRPPATLRNHFDHLRTLVANAYYATEPGMRELGWAGRTAWRELPGCDHPEGEHE